MAATSSVANLFSFFNSSSSSSPQSAPPKSQLSIPSSNSPRNEVMSVVWPSVAHANTLLFRSGYNVQVIVDDNEPEERLIGRFRREVMRVGIIQECKRRRYFENKQEEKKRRVRDAAKRNRRARRPSSRMAFQERQEAASKPKKSDDDEADNWDLPEGGLP